MEGLLQSLKLESPDLQRRALGLSGRAAKRAATSVSWNGDQPLFWQGEAIDRHSPAYQQLLDEAFTALFDQNAKARRALLATGDARLTHSIGKNDPTETILTAAEFCARLTRRRADLRSGAVTAAAASSTGAELRCPRPFVPGRGPRE